MPSFFFENMKPCSVVVAALNFVISSYCLTLLFAVRILASEESATANPRIIEHPDNQYVARNEPATLNCKAEGDPPPVISWYRDGLPVVTANENPSSHRMLLPSGQLFFLRIITSKNSKPDLGVYYCNATNPETKVSVISRNATLELAVIGNEFREQPGNAEVAVGADVVLGCRAPKGEPEPRVRWKKDGELVKPSDRITVADAGSLKIRDSRREDAGLYVCVAYNVGGEKESVPAKLSVREKPRIIEGPKDIVAQENSDVSFHCSATGDPKPTIIWKKVDDQMPQGRMHILEDKSLKIERVRLADEGIYVCRAENTVGFQEAEAKLIVHSQPSFLITPRDKVVGLGRRAVFRCEVVGNPAPAVFWNKEGSQTLLFPNQDHGRLSVSDDGTLTIESVEREDGGEYVCKGLSIAGSAYAKAKLDIKDVDSRPPPIIHQGPQNQTLPVSSVAMLPCSTSGDPPPLIRWYRNGRVLSLRDPRFTILDSGMLQISDLRKTDSGLYTCKAISETGETGWSAALIVETPTNPTIIFHRTPEPSTFPGPPSKPSISDVTETSVRLTWRNNANHGASPVYAYTVEYFSHETGKGWIVASDSVIEQTYTIRGLQQDTAYMFLIRAQNSHGLSLPSPVTAPIRTKGIGNSQSRPTVPSLDLTIVAERLSNQVVWMLPGEVMSSTAVKVTWEVRKNHRFIEGYHIHYRTVMELDSHSSGGGSDQPRPFTTETVQSNGATMYTLHNLEKDSWYEIHIQPFYQSVVGQASNSIRVKTLEDTPSAAPQNIRARMVDNSTLHITWDTPPRQHFNGALRGYKIYIYGNETKFDREIQINSTLDAIYIHSMIKDMTYKIQMSAWNKMGEGLRSEAIVIGPLAHSVRQNLFQEPWFIATLIVSIGGVIWITLCIFSVWVYRKRKTCKKIPKSVHLNKVAADCPRNGSILTPMTITSYLEKENNAENIRLASVVSANSKENLTKDNGANLQNPFPTKNFHDKSLLVMPYATTNLINPVNDSKAAAAAAEATFQAIHHHQGKLRTDAEQFNRRHDMSACDSNVDHQNIPDEHGHQKPLMLFLPPPPEHPPPSDIGTPPDSPVPGGAYSGERNFSGAYFPADGNNCRMMNHSGCGLRNLHSDCERDMRSYHGGGGGGGGGGGQTNWSGSLNPRSQLYQRQQQQQQLQNSHNGPSYLLHKPASFRMDCQRPPPSGYPPQRPTNNVDYNPTSSSAFRNVQLNSARDVSGEQFNRLYNNGCENSAGANPQWVVAQSTVPNNVGFERGLQSSIPNIIRGHSNNSWLNASNNIQNFEQQDSPPESELDIRDYEQCSDVVLPTLCDYPSASDTEVMSGQPFDTLWEAANDSDANCSSLRSSEGSEEEVASFLPDADFASAVAKAAQLSGLTVVGSTVTDPTAMDQMNCREKVKKPAKYRQRARCTSPYSTDSNYSTLQVPHRPYPKSDRKRQLREHGGSRYNGQDARNNLSNMT